MGGLMYVNLENGKGWMLGKEENPARLTWEMQISLVGLRA